MPFSDNMPKRSEKFDDIWQEILPGLEPLPPEVRHTDDKNIKHAPCRVGRSEKKDDCYEDVACFLRIRIDQECSICGFYQALIKKCPKRVTQHLVPLEKLQDQVLARLMTLYFLKTGDKGACGKACPYISSVPHAIRNLCNEEAESGNKYKQAASQTDDQRLASAFAEIAEIKIQNSVSLIRILGSVINQR